jgi:hypothetical protein
LGNSFGILWDLWLGGSDLEFFCECFENSIRIPCEFLGNSLGILRKFFGNSIKILLEFFGDVWLGGSECVSVDFG